MKCRSPFFRCVSALAIPVALQSMLQSSFSMVDQIMLGQLGSVSVAGVGLAGKFASIFSVVVSAVGAVAGIMLAQYLGQDNRREVRRSFWINLLLGAGIGVLFTLLCALFPDAVMGLYIKDSAARQAAAEYLFILSGAFLPMAGAALISTLFRCMEKPRLPLYASIFSALLNTVLNYILIFGKCGFAPMGARGAAIATLISQWANLLLMVMMLPRTGAPLARSGQDTPARFHWRQYWSMLLPILVCEVLWSLGENVYAAIYGRMSTAASAAMTLTNPVQGLVMGALCGLSQAAAVLVGKDLGRREPDAAYRTSRKLLLYGAAGAILLSLLVAAVSPLYVRIYQVDEAVRLLTRQLLTVYALIAPFKALNMILGGGILRSGGKTRYAMFIDIVGTWVLGVPMGLLAAFVWHLPVQWVYLLLSLEECARFLLSLMVFRRKKWMHSLESDCMGPTPSAL